nr:hypothetical protein [Tanacetum cinerariifolium]
NKEGLGYNAVPPPAQIYSPPKKDLSWIGLPEFVDDTVTDYSRPYLQNEHDALWEVIEFGDSYKAPPEETGKGPTSEGSAKKKGRTVAITTEDMQKRRNDVKARTTLLLALLDEH